jgi:hypothetical protein
MASASVPATPAPVPNVPLSRLLSSARTMFVGLLWGGILLLILAAWLWLKFRDDRGALFPALIAGIGIVGLALAGWHAFTIWFQKAPEDQRVAALSNQRRITALAVLAGGAALAIIALTIAFASWPGAPSGVWPRWRTTFGETVGLFLFAVFAMGVGRSLMSPPRAEGDTVDLEPIRPLLPLIRAGLFIAAILLAIGFISIVFHYKEEAPPPREVDLKKLDKVEPDQRGTMRQAFATAWSNVGPELAGIVLFSVMCVTLGLWLRSTPSPDPFETRLFVLILGGCTGLILFLMTLARAIVWRDRVFFSGMAVWQGEESWQLWLCVYLQLIALALMFGSLMLARADIRSNAILRRVLFGYNTVLNGLLVLQMVIVLNIVAYALVPYTFDWTSTRGLHALAQSSKNLLHELKQPTHVFVLLSQGMASQSDVRVLLENIRAESDKVDIDYIAPDRDIGRYMELGKKFPKILPDARGLARDQESGRGILIVYGPIPKDANHKVPYTFIPERKIYDESPGGFQQQKASKTFKGEVEVIKELNYLVRGGEKRKLYFLQGNDEIDITQTQPFRRLFALQAEMSRLGASMLVDKLKKDNYEVEAITFVKSFAQDESRKNDKVRYIGEAGPDKRPELPDPKEAYAVVIAGASAPFSPEALAAIERYVERGGKLMVLLDIVLTKDPQAKTVKDLKLRESGLETVLKKYGIESTDEFAIADSTIPNRPIADPFAIPSMPPEKSDNLLAKQFANEQIVFRTVRVIRPAAGGKFKAEPVFTSIPWRPQLRGLIPAVIAVRDTGAFGKPQDYFEEAEQQGTLLKRVTEELPLVVAVSDDSRPRMVVFGDTEFISNDAMRSENNYSLFVSALEWMSERGEGLIGPQPKVQTTVEMPARIATNYTRVHLVPLWLMFIGIVGLGGGMWLIRRR